MRVRGSFTVGFAVLLVLIVGDGAISYRRIGALEEEVRIGSQTNAHDMRVALDLRSQISRLAAEWRTFMVTRSMGGVTFPSRNRIRQLEERIDALFESQRGDPIAKHDEWAGVRGAYAAYVSDLETRQSMPPEGDLAFEDLEDASDRLIDRIQRNVQELDEQAKALRIEAQRDVVVTTTVCFVVGLMISVLVSLDTRRSLQAIEESAAEADRQRAFAESVLDGMDSAVVTVDREARVTSINDSALYVLDVGPERDLIGRDVLEAFDAHPPLAALIRQLFEGPPAGRRYLGRVEMGRSHWLLDVGASPLGGEGDHRGYVITLADVTEAERANEELRRNRALTAVGQMTAQVAHEIKNPLGGMRLAAQLLERKLKDDEQGLEIVRRLQNSVDHLARTVTELNQFARPAEPVLEPVRLAALLDELLMLVADKVEAKEIRVLRSYEDVAEGLFDPGELRKAFINFLLNALEASPNGTRLWVSVGQTGDQVRIAVRDEGSGMTQETLRRLFEPFYTTKPQGTGLGMAIARKIVELHRGRLDVASAEGEGTEVVVTLPLVRARVPEGESEVRA